MVSTNSTRFYQGVELHLYADGAIMWSANWLMVLDAANAGDPHFRYVSGGPETFGHTDIYWTGLEYGPAYCANCGMSRQSMDSARAHLGIRWDDAICCEVL